MGRRSTFVLSALAALTVAKSARAESDFFQPRLELGLAGGAFLPSKDHELFDPKLNQKQEFKNAGLDVALRLGIYPFSFFGAELEGGVMPLRTLGENGATLFALRGHGILQLPYAFTPFVLAGGGFWGLRSSEIAVGNDIDPTFHWGVGVKYGFAKDITFRLDGRHIISASRGHGNTDHFEALSGISFSFGGSDVHREYRPIDVVRPVPLAVFTPPVQEVIPEPVIQQPDPVAIAEKIQAAQETREKVEAAFDRVHFAWGSANLRESDRHALDDAAELLSKHTSLKVEIRGHTDSTGPERFNIRLSEKRANTVRGYLVGKGIETARLGTRGYGPYQPVKSNKTSEGRSENRRGEIVVEETDETLQITVR